MVAITEGLRDILGGLRRGHITITLGWQEIATRYHRSRVGPFWLTINKGVLIAALSFVFGSLFGLDASEFIPFLAVGLILWGFIAGALSDGCSAFTGAAGTILQVRLPLSTHVATVLLRNVLVLAHNFLIIPLVFLFFLKPINLMAFLSIAGLFLLVLNLSWMMLFLAVVCARFRDVTEIVVNILQVLFYLTPIIWTVELIKDRAPIWVLQANPFFHLIEIVRAPLLGQTTQVINWIIPICLAVIGWSISIIFFGRYRRRIAYWL